MGVSPDKAFTSWVVLGLCAALGYVIASYNVDRALTTGDGFWLVFALTFFSAETLFRLARGYLE